MYSNLIIKIIISNLVHYFSFKRKAPTEVFLYATPSHLQNPNPVKNHFFFSFSIINIITYKNLYVSCVISIHV